MLLLCYVKLPNVIEKFIIICAVCVSPNQEMYIITIMLKRAGAGTAIPQFQIFFNPPFILIHDISIVTK